MYKLALSKYNMLITMKFYTEIIGQVKYAPNLRIQVSCVHYIASTHKVFSVDIRKWYKLARETWVQTKSGVSISRDLALELQNAICQLPEEIDLAGKDYLKLWSAQKTAAVELYLGLGKLYSMFGLDVREFVHDDAHHYHGFSIKGFRLPVECAADLADLILQAVTRIDNEVAKTTTRKAGQAGKGLEGSADEVVRGKAADPKAFLRKPRRKAK